MTGTLKQLNMSQVTLLNLSLFLFYLTKHHFAIRNRPQELFRTHFLCLRGIFHTIGSYPSRFLQENKVPYALLFFNAQTFLTDTYSTQRKRSGYGQEVTIQKRKRKTSGTMRENPNLINRRRCSMTKIIASPGSMLHFPS